MLPISEKKAIAVFRANAKDYINEDMLKNLDGLPISRKGIEFFVIMFMGIVFMATYFSKAIPSIMKWGNKTFGESADMADMDDITKVASMFKSNIKANYDIKRRFNKANKMLATLFKTAIKNRITFQTMNFNFDVSGGFLKMTISGTIYSQNPNNFNSFKRSIVNQKPFVSCSGTRMENKYKYEITGRFNLASSSWFMKMKYKRSSSKKIKKQIMRYMSMHTGNDTRLLFGVSTNKRGIQISSIGIEGTTKNYKRFLSFFRAIESIPETLQCMPMSINFRDGKFWFKLNVTCCYR
jgi:hypothetical protein